MTSEIESLPERELATRRIYAYRFKLSELEGRIKVGETGRAVRERIDEQIRTAGLADLVEILFNEPAIDRAGHAFADKAVHAELKKLPNVDHLNTGGGSEWFECSLDDVRNAYQSVVAGRTIEPGRTEDFRPRDEQTRAVAQTKAYFDAVSVADPTAVPRFLWNAKMRFGKTFAAYNLALELKAKRVLVATFKPVVADAWKTDLETHVQFEGWVFRQTGNEPVAGQDEKYVYFASFQDLFGVDQSGRFKPKNAWIADEHWDLVIFDEYHYGAWRYADELLAGESGGGKQDVEAEFTEASNLFDEEQDEWGKDEIDFLPFQHAGAFLYLSGTPFRALASGKFAPEQIFNWTYTDEQAAKAEWVEGAEQLTNPYAALPGMQLLTYEVPAEMRAIAATGVRNEFDLNAFFKASGSGNNAKFDQADFVLAWLDWLRGQGAAAIETALDAQAMPMPFASAHIRQYLDHSVWFLPSVAAVHAMRNLLTAPGSWWGDYGVLAVAGESAGIGEAALPPVTTAIGSGYDTKTITLTCGKLLTGVTVRQWASIFMLCNLSSPETYFQAAFRVQSAWSVKNPDGDEPRRERVEKPACLVIDFAPSRALRLYADYGVRLGTGADPQQDLHDLAKYLPVLAFEGASMHRVDAGEILDVALQSASVDARQMDSLRYINPRAGIHARLGAEAKGALDAIRVVHGKASKKAKDSPTIVADDPDIEPTTATGNEEGGGGREDPEADVGALTKRLQFLARRINAFMYLSQNYEKTLADVLATDEVELFQQVMELTPSQMGALVRAGLFNESALRLAILQFARAERESLPYTGIDPWADGIPVTGVADD